MDTSKYTSNTRQITRFCLMLHTLNIYSKQRILCCKQTPHIGQNNPPRQPFKPCKRPRTSTNRHIPGRILPECITHDLFSKIFVWHGIRSLASVYSFNYERKVAGVEAIGSERESSDGIGGYVRFHSAWSNMKHRYVEWFQFHEQNLADTVNSSLRSAVQAIPWSRADEV